MGFGHLYVNAEPDAVVEGIRRHLAGLGFHAVEMTPERHPKRMKELLEGRQRLYWVSPLQGRWTGIFEYRYYANDDRQRWGYADEYLAVALSKALGEVWRLEVLDGAGFWLYAHYVGGEEKEGRAYQDAYGDRTTDRSHPRYELNHIIEREGFRNIGLGYEHIPGPQVAPIESVPQSAEGIEGMEGFRHLAFERPAPEEPHAPA